MTNNDDGILSMEAPAIQKQAQEDAAFKETSRRLDEMQAQLWADERRLTGVAACELVFLSRDRKQHHGGAFTGAQMGPMWKNPQPVSFHSRTGRFLDGTSGARGHYHDLALCGAQRR